MRGKEKTQLEQPLREWFTDEEINLENHLQQIYHEEFRNIRKTIKPIIKLEHLRNSEARNIEPIRFAQLHIKTSTYAQIAGYLRSKEDSDHATASHPRSFDIYSIFNAFTIMAFGSRGRR